MAKYSERLVAKIVKLIEGDLYTISEICDVFGINRKSFYEWKKEKPEFAREIADAIDRRDDALVRKARRSLQELVEGYEVVEEKSFYIPDIHNPANRKLKSTVVKKKKCPPSVAALKLVLERDDRKKEKRNEKETDPRNKPFTIVVRNKEEADALDLLWKNGQNPDNRRKAVSNPADEGAYQAPVVKNE